MDNEAQLAQSMTVASLANQKLHSSLALPDLVKNIAVTVPANTTFLQIGCHDTSATSAATCANDFANAYLANRYSSAVSAINHTQSVLGGKIDALQADRDPPRSGSTRSPEVEQGDRSVGALNADDLTVKGLENQLNQATVVLAGLPASVGTVASPATPPTSASSPRILLLLPSGLLAGLVIGLVLAFVVDRRDKRIHSSATSSAVWEFPSCSTRCRCGPGCTGGSLHRRLSPGRPSPSSPSRWPPPPKTETRCSSSPAPRPGTATASSPPTWRPHWQGHGPRWSSSAPAVATV